jgi:imidazolonepropionase-like amidohydrolase
VNFRLIPLAALAIACFAADNSFLLRNVTIHPVSGAKIENASLLVVDGKIADFGQKIAAKAKVRAIDGKGLHVYPGLIDSGSAVGLSEISSVRETTDIGEIGEFNPQLRALIAVNPSSEHIPVARANGITASMLVPGATAVEGRRGGGSSTYIAGQVSLANLNGWTWEQMEIRRGAALQLLWPAIPPTREADPDGPPPGFMAMRRTTFAENQRTQKEQVQKITEFFAEARAYRTAKAAGIAGFKTDLKFEAMLPVLEGKLPLMIFAAREREIKEAVAWAEKQQVKFVLANVRRPGKMTEEIAKKKIPVILGTPFTSPAEEDDPYDEPYSLAGHLFAAGVKVPYEAGQSVAFGLPQDEALKAVTLNAAEIWGIGDQYGSIEKGKIADLIVTDGDPLEVRTHVQMMFIKGESVDLESKHTRLYKQYLARP